MPLKPLSKRATVDSIKKRKSSTDITPRRKSPKTKHKYGKHR